MTQHNAKTNCVEISPPAVVEIKGTVFNCGATKPYLVGSQVTCPGKRGSGIQVAFYGQVVMLDVTRQSTVLS